MAEINLLDSQTHSSAIKAQGKLWLLRIVTIVFFAALIGYALLFVFGWLANRSIASEKATIAEYQADIKSNKQRQELLTRQGQLKNVNQLLASHKYWSPVLPELARVTLTSAKYTAITADVKGELELTVTTPSYEEAEKFLQVFDLPEYNKQFSNVKVMALTKAQVGDSLQTTMRLRLTLDPSFLKKSKPTAE